MALKLISTVLNFDDTKVIEFKIRMFKDVNELHRYTKKESIKYLDDCIAHINGLKQFILSDIEKSELTAIKQSMKTTPILGKVLMAIGFKNDNMGAAFEPDVLYKTEDYGWDEFIIVRV